MSCVVCVVGASMLRYESMFLYTLPRLRKSGNGSRPVHRSVRHRCHRGSHWNLFNTGVDNLSPFVALSVVTFHRYHQRFRSFRRVWARWVLATDFTARVFGVLDHLSRSHHIFVLVLLLALLAFVLALLAFVLVLLVILLILDTSKRRGWRGCSAGGGTFQVADISGHDLVALASGVVLTPRRVGARAVRAAHPCARQTSQQQCAAARPTLQVERQRAPPTSA